ncbi:MAG TPA: TolC family protein [Dissulfurispiraceae bacterium]|nr:TolC family protein [Dissulfurispiraceae bacterium]
MKMNMHMRKTGARISSITVVCAAIASLAAPLYAADQLSLKECLNAALSQNPVIADAKLGIETTEKSMESAQGKHWPRLTADGSYIKRQDPLPFIPAQSAKIQPHFSNEFSSLGLTLFLPLYQGGQVTNGVSLAEVRRDIQEQVARQTTYEIMANVVNTYYKIIQLRQLREAAAASVTALEEQQKNTKLLLALGRIARVDFLKVEVQLANERQRLLSIDEGIKIAASTLRYLRGEAEEKDESEVPNLTDVPTERVFPADFPIGISLARKHRPEYLSAKQGIKEAEFSRKIAFGKLLPSVNAFAGYLQQYGSDPWYKEGNWQTGISFSIPLFDRSLYADLSRERIQEKRAKEKLDAIDNQIGLDVKNALTALAESKGRIDVTKGAVEQAEESFRIEKQKYDSGAGTMVDLLLAQAASLNAAANYIQSLFDYNAAIVAYRKATGTLEDYLK